MRQLIVKIGQPVEGLELYVRRDRTVSAKRMKSDFMIETRRGWDQGHRGDWLLKIGGSLWSIVSDDDFRKIYRRHDEGDCLGPCDHPIGGEPL